LQDVCNRDIIIYRWTPHGSRKLEDLLPLLPLNALTNNPHLLVTTQPMICHDQEPLNYSYWTIEDFVNHIMTEQKESETIARQFAPWHLRTALSRRHRAHVFGYTLLCHSEINSAELVKYEDNNFLGVYYWSHALIARDWFRYAEVDRSLATKNSQCDFLIYNRAWSGTREYRLKFAELLVQNNLQHQCLTKFNTHDGCDYRQHKFANSTLNISNYQLENYFADNSISSCASGDYSAADYKASHIEVVLETLFDDSRWHLTEKILRPIACGQPFILASTAGSLSFLKRYGFKTFDSVFDESYDRIQEPLPRLQAIVALMNNLSSRSDKQQIFERCKEIAKYNQCRFFSPDFHKQVVNEFKDNFDTAYRRSLQSCNLEKLNQCWSAIRQSGDWDRASMVAPHHAAAVEYQRQYVENFIASVKSSTLTHPTLRAAESVDNH